ncbi:hypothetical protein C8J28_101335 [Cereibacter azotoformans]|uniref:Uncharacterized protein n=1 Tax=Cereibacter azotoformans TaxID=43057 RepID=A0A2T5KF30_9RHOB|nr:hypothetical protein C8J28_101335 [Cereibacter azotoformans]
MTAALLPRWLRVRAFLRGGSDEVGLPVEGPPDERGDPQGGDGLMALAGIGGAIGGDLLGSGRTTRAAGRIADGTDAGGPAQRIPGPGLGDPRRTDRAGDPQAREGQLPLRVSGTAGRRRRPLGPSSRKLAPTSSRRGRSKLSGSSPRNAAARSALSSQPAGPAGVLKGLLSHRGQPRSRAVELPCGAGSGRARPGTETVTPSRGCEGVTRVGQKKSEATPLRGRACRTASINPRR